MDAHFQIIGPLFSFHFRT